MLDATPTAQDPQSLRNVLGSRILEFHQNQWSRGPSAPSGSSVGSFSHAVRARENCAEAPDGIDVWRYDFPPAANQSIDDLHVRTPESPQWTGIFGCARGGHVEVFPWPGANALVVAASNALYIVDPDTPERFSGIPAPIGITDVIFDEEAREMFVADSLRIYSFSVEGLLRWVSEPLEGYTAHFLACKGRVLAVEVKQPVPGIEDMHDLVMRLRTEDGTILRSRFRQVQSHWMRKGAA